MTPAEEPRGQYDTAGACRYLSIGLTKLKELVATKEIERVYVGTAPRYPRESLDGWRKRLPNKPLKKTA